MADQNGDPEVDLDLDPPVEDAVEQEIEEQDQQAEEQETEVEDDAVDASGQQTERQPDQQTSRGERRYQTLSNELRAQREANIALNARLEAYLSGQVQRSQQGESPEARAQRRSLLSSEERMQEDLQGSRQQVATEMQMLQFQVKDGNDRAAFEAKATVKPLYAKWRDRVEAQYQTLVKQNQFVERENILAWMIGKRALEQGEPVRTQQRQQGAARVRSQTTRPSNSGSDVAANRRSDRNASLERRLENQQL
jgi:hypothetical protein